MTKLEWGTKRACQSCSARFYDLHHTPIVCPKCGETFEIQTSNRRSKARATMADDLVKPLEDDLLIADLDLQGDLDADLDEDEDSAALIEDTSDLGEDLDDMADVIDTVNDSEEQ